MYGIDFNAPMGHRLTASPDTRVGQFVFQAQAVQWSEIHIILARIPTEINLMENSTVQIHRLPVQPTLFVGRNDELRQICRTSCQLGSPATSLDSADGQNAPCVRSGSSIAKRLSAGRVFVALQALASPDFIEMLSVEAIGLQSSPTVIPKSNCLIISAAKQLGYPRQF